jgi:hypothetical protein
LHGVPVNFEDDFTALQACIVGRAARLNLTDHGSMNVLSSDDHFRS